MTGDKHGLRRDIQGLRALAVVVVVMNHMFGWPSGGYVGVDIFFVISGFLITDLMLREHDRTGRVSWMNFYRRRVRRIFPAAWAVLLLTVVIANFLYPAIRARLIRQDALWAMVFLSNWHFAKVKTDYFNNEALVSPLQHFWSLAVEEQFYMVWPLLVIALSAIAARRLPYRRVLAVVIGLIVIVSFAYAMTDTRYHATSAYFSTPARAWELGVGALIAVSARRLARLPAWTCSVLAYVGLAGIAFSLAVISDSSTFPAPWAALPVLSAAEVIVGGLGGVPRGGLVLTNPVAQYIGNISYSLYLWHFPIIIMTSDFDPKYSFSRMAMVVAAMSCLAIFSFHFIEDPIRRSSWLEPRRSHRRPLRYRDVFDRTFLRRAGVMVLAFSALSTTAFAGHLTSRKIPHDLPPIAINASGGGGPVTFESRLRARISASLSATTFPALVPSVDHLDDNKAPQWAINGCGTTGAWNAQKCTYGPEHNQRVVAVIGDSIALSWLPGLISAFGSHGYRLHSFVAGSCPASDVNVGDEVSAQTCAAHREWALQAIARLKPDLIVLSDAVFLVPKLTDHAQGSVESAEWQAGVARTLRRLTPVGRTLVLSSPPGSKNLLSCMTIRATPIACSGNLDDPSVQVLEKAEKAAARATGADYLDATPLFCASNGQCPSFVGTTPVYVDGLHLTRQYSAYVAPALTSLLGLDGKRK